MDFSFLGGSMGSVVGEKLTRLIETGTEKRLPVVVGDGLRLFPEHGPALDMALVESRATPSGISIQAYRPAGRLAQFASLDE